MTPVDQHIRQRATSGLDVSMALSAGAGSGKTSVLSERVVETLLAGVPPSAVAGITFTEKAAGELVVRVRDALERRLQTATQQGDGDVSARVGAALQAFSTLTITTIHSFCAGLLSREAFAADVAPGAEVGVDDLLQRRMRERVVDFRRGLRRTQPLVYDVLDALGSDAALADAALALEAWSEYDDGTADLHLDVTAARAALRIVRDDITAALSRCHARDTDVRIQNNLPFIAAVDEALADDEALARALASEVGPSKRGGRKGDWDAGGLDAFAAALDAVVGWRTTWQGAVWAEVVRRLRADVVAPFVEVKRDAGQCSFQDLLTLTATLLRTQPAARARLAARFGAILVDEVQDTDPLQAEIALLLSRPPDGGGGCLFAVGDPRQSIYRFRGADADTFTRLEAMIATDGERHALVTNFRSVPGIVDWVNHTFGALPGYVAQHAARSAGESALDPVVVLDGAADADPPVDELGAAIAWLQGLLSSGQTVTIKGVTRALSARDVIVLLPSWGHADGIADALRARGIAAVVEGGGAFFQRDEVRLLVEALRVLVEPADGEATVSVLRGLFGVSFVDMARHLKAGGALRCTLPSPVPGVVADALTVLRTLHRRVGFVGLAGLLDELLAQTRAQAVHVLLRDGEARSANVDKLLSMVRDLEREATGPHAVLDELLQLVRSRAGEKDVDRLDDDSDAVRVTTLFKAKGLEAPVVVLLHATRKQDTPKLVIDHVQRRILVAVRGLRPPTWADAEAHEQAALFQERRRWMYVAATRARDQLVVCRVQPKKKANNQLLDTDVEARGLPQDVATRDHRWHPSGEPRATVRLVPMASLSPSSAGSATFVSMLPGSLDATIDAAMAQAVPTTGDPDGDAFVRTAREAVRTAARACVRWRSPSREKATVPQACAASTTTGADVVAVEDPAVAVGARVGKVVHEVMERLHLGAEAVMQQAQVQALTPLLARRAGLSDDEAGVVALIAGRICAHPVMGLCRAAPEHWREVPFSHPVGTRGVVTGVIDLCFPLDETRRRWVIFDWKSKLPPEHSPLRAHYEQQLAAYARALLQGFGDVEIAQTVLVGPHKELGPPRGVDDVLAEVGAGLPSAERAALATLLPQLGERGIALPEVEFELEDDVPSQATLCFFAEKVAVAVDTDDPGAFGVVDPGASADHRARLAARGWRLCDTVGEAARLLGLAVEDDDEDAADDGGEPEAPT